MLSNATNASIPSRSHADGPLFAAVIKASAVRDAQHCVSSELDPNDDCSWLDCRDAEIFLDFFRDRPGQDALHAAAEYAGVAPENIRLIPVPADAFHP